MAYVILRHLNCHHVKEQELDAEAGDRVSTVQGVQLQLGAEGVRKSQTLFSFWTDNEFQLAKGVRSDKGQTVVAWHK